MDLTLRREVWIGDAPLADDEGEVVQHRVLGADSTLIIVRDMRKVGHGAEVVPDEVTGRYEVVEHAWQISLDGGHSWQEGDYQTAEAARVSLERELTTSEQCSRQLL